jgi:hypothetical protein
MRRFAIVVLLVLSTAWPRAANAQDVDPPPPPLVVPRLGPVRPTGPTLARRRELEDAAPADRPTDPVLLLTLSRVRWALGDVRGFQALGARLERIQPGHLESALALLVAASQSHDARAVRRELERSTMRGLSPVRAQFLELVVDRRLDLRRALAVSPERAASFVEESERLSGERSLGLLLAAASAGLGASTSAVIVLGVTQCFVRCEDDAGSEQTNLLILGATLGVLTLIVTGIHAGVLADARRWRRRFDADLARALTEGDGGRLSWRF